MCDEAKDRLWESSFETFYDAYYCELCGGTLIQRWSLINKLAIIIVAVTASGSAISGWTIWETSLGYVLWSILAGSAALISIAVAVIQPPSLIEQHKENYALAVSLRIRLGQFRDEIYYDPGFSVDKKASNLAEMKNELAEILTDAPADLLFTVRFQLKVQDRLDGLLEDQKQP